MTRLVLRNARHLITVDATNQVVDDVSVVVDDGTITHIIPAGDAAATELATASDGDTQIIDASHHAVLPGLVNLHTHLPMTLLRGIAEDVDLQGFLRIVWAAEGAVMDAPTVELGAQLGAVESLLAGATTQLDMYLHHAAAHRGAAATGARHVGGPVFFDGSGPDGLEWPDRMRELAEWPSLLTEIGGPWVPPAAMPHSTYTNSPEHLREVAEAVAAWKSAVLHTHVSENFTENADVAARYGKTPIGVLESAGWFEYQHKIVLAHGVHLTDQDRQTIAGKATLAHCPGSNMKLASGGFDWKSASEQNVRVGLGTDGCSSSNDLDMWQTMRQAALLARHLTGQPDAVSAADVIRAATIDSATALGLDHLVGSIEVGKHADLVMIDLDQPHLVPNHDIAALLVFAAGRGDVTDVIVDGEVVVHNRQCTRVDVAELLAASRRRGKDAVR